jgi:hypothetical protein
MAGIDSIRSEVARLQVYGAAVNNCERYDTYYCPKCGAAEFTAYADGCYCHACKLRLSMDDMITVLHKKGSAITETSIRLAVKAQCYTKYGQKMRPSKQVVAEYPYYDRAGREVMVDYAVVENDSTEGRRTLVAVEAVDKSLLWQWGGVPKNDCPLYTGPLPSYGNYSGKCVIVTADENAVNIIMEAVSRKEELANSIAAVSVYRGTSGISATSFSDIVSTAKQLVVWHDFTADEERGFLFGSKLLEYLSSSQSTLLCETRQVTQASLGAAMPARKAVVGMSVSEILNDMLLDSIVATLTSPEFSVPFNSVAVREAQCMFDEGSSYVPQAPSTSAMPDEEDIFKCSGGEKFSAHKVMEYVFKECEGVLYTVDSEFPYLLMGKGKYANQTLNLSSHAFSMFVQHTAAMLGCPVMPLGTRAAVEKAIQSSEVTRRYNDRKVYEYMGNTYCAFDGKLYVNLSQTQIAEFDHDGTMRVIPKGCAPVQFRPDDHEMIMFAAELPEEPALAYREMIDTLFPTIDASVRPLVAGYLIMAPVSYRYTKPIVSFVGEAGSGKTTAAVLFKDIVEQIPSSGWEGYVDQTTPKALAAYISGNVVSIFDNSTLASQQVSAFLSGIVTGKSYTQRTLFTTAEKSITELNSILLYTSIETPTKEADTADRMLTVQFDGAYTKSREASDTTFGVSYVSTQAALLPVMRRLNCMFAAMFMRTPFEELTLLKEFSGNRMGIFLSALAQAASLVGYTRAEVVTAYQMCKDSTVAEVGEVDPLLQATAGVINRAIANGTSELAFNQFYTAIVQDMELSGNIDAKPSSGRALKRSLRLMKPLLEGLGLRVALWDGGSNVRIKSLRV